MRNILTIVLFAASCLLAAMTPLFGPLIDNTTTMPARPFPGWQAIGNLAGGELKPLPLTDQEQQFAKGFPGKLARFQSGNREIIARWVYQPTRRLHSEVVCFQGLGYQITAQRPDLAGQYPGWKSFLARRGEECLAVKFLIIDEHGNRWQEVSAWYWAATLGRSKGPWWAVTIAENASGN